MTETFTESRNKITHFVCDGSTLARAHHWDKAGRYSTKTFLNNSEARAWLRGKSRGFSMPFTGLILMPEFPTET